MDPTYSACQFEPLSFRRDLTSSKLAPPHSFELTLGMLKSTQIQENLQKSFADPALISTRDTKLKQFLTLSTQRRRKFNPFEQLGSGPYATRAAYKLADMNSVFNIIPPVSNSNHFIFADVAGGPGSWTQYVQSQAKAYNRGFGISLVTGTKELDWDNSIIEYKSFKAYGYDGMQGKKGDVTKEWADFIKMVLGDPEGKNGCDLIMCDGGFEPINYDTREQEHFPLAWHESLIGTSIGKPGSSLIVKMYDTHQPISRDLIFALAHGYEKVNLYKPVSSRLFTDERYIVTRGRREIDLGNYGATTMQLFQQLSPRYADATKINPAVSIFTNVPKEFDEWLIGENNRLLASQIVAMSEKTNLHWAKANLLWNTLE